VAQDKRMSDDINVPEAKKDECKEKLEHAKDRFTSANARLLHRMTVAEEHKDALIDETLLSMVPARPPALAHTHTHTQSQSQLQSQSQSQSQSHTVW
jgi:sarcosine oxidase gamma subunit